MAAQVTTDARATLGSWGSGIGSFFANSKTRFSLSRNNSSTSLPVTPPPQAGVVLPEIKDNNEETTPTPTPTLNGNAEHSKADADISAL
jgi:hypothetical protein